MRPIAHEVHQCGTHILAGRIVSVDVESLATVSPHLTTATHFDPIGDLPPTERVNTRAQSSTVLQHPDI